MTKDYMQYFEWKTRTNDKAYVVLIEDAPKELQQLIYHIHDDIFESLPNDWIYSVIYEAFDELARDKLEDITIEGDAYNSHLYEWFGNSFATLFCNEHLENLAANGECSIDIYELLREAQSRAIRIIYEGVDHFLTEQDRSYDGEH